MDLLIKKYLTRKSKLLGRISKATGQIPWPNRWSWARGKGMQKVTRHRCLISKSRCHRNMEIAARQGEHEKRTRIASFSFEFHWHFGRWPGPFVFVFHLHFGPRLYRVFFFWVWAAQFVLLLTCFPGPATTFGRLRPSRTIVVFQMHCAIGSHSRLIKKY